MKKVILKQSGLETFPIGLGLSRLHYMSQKEGEDLLSAAVDLGISHFDTARYYGDGYSERVLSSLLQKGRNKVTVATKFGILPNPLIEHAGLARYPIVAARAILRRLGMRTKTIKDYSATALTTSLHASLRALKTEYVDVLFLHEPSFEEAQILVQDDALFMALERFRREGKVRHVGIAADCQTCLFLSSRWAEIIDITQTAENNWTEETLVPDITYSLFSQKQSLGVKVALNCPARDVIRRVLERRPQGMCLVSTTKLEHLKELVGI